MKEDSDERNPQDDPETILTDEELDNLHNICWKDQDAPRFKRRIKGFLAQELAELPQKTLLDETQLARMLHVTRRTVRRMVSRGELPPPIRLAGRSVWLAGNILKHFEAAAERAEREAEQEARRLEGYDP